MMRILVINSNTSVAVTERVADVAGRFVSPGTELVFATGTFGPEIIATRTEDVIAAHSTVDLVARHATECDGILIAVSYDSGLRAARELTDRPVLALTESSLLAAVTLGTRIGLVIWGVGAVSLYLEKIESYGLATRICGVRSIGHPLPQTSDADKRLDDAVLIAANELIQQHEAEVVVLVGALLAGRSVYLEPSVPVPLLDGMRCGLPMLEAVVRIAPRPPIKGSYAFRGGRSSIALSDELSQKLSTYVDV